jgi:hypothetical protein
MPASPRALGLLSSILGLGLFVACGDDTGSGGSGGSDASSSSSGGPSTSSSGAPSSSSSSTASSTASSATSSSSSGSGGEGGMALSDALLYHGDFATDAVHQVGFSTYPGPTTTIYTPWPTRRIHRRSPWPVATPPAVRW